MFNVGDVVKCVDDSRHEGFSLEILNLHGVYKIVRLEGGSVCLEGASTCWGASRFQLHTPAPQEPPEDVPHIARLSIPPENNSFMQYKESYKLACDAAKTWAVQYPRGIITIYRAIETHTAADPVITVTPI